MDKIVADMATLVAVAVNQELAGEPVRVEVGDGIERRRFYVNGVGTSLYASRDGRVWRRGRDGDWEVAPYHLEHDRWAGVGRAYRRVHDTATRRKYLASRVVYSAWHGEATVKGLDVHHVNGDPLDDRLGNLVALTRREHGRVHNRWQRQGALMSRKYAAGTVACPYRGRILAEHAATGLSMIGESARQLARALGIDPSAVGRCLRGRTHEASGWTFRPVDETVDKVERDVDAVRY